MISMYRRCARKHSHRCQSKLAITHDQLRVEYEVEGEDKHSEAAVVSLLEGEGVEHRDDIEDQECQQHSAPPAGSRRT